MIPYKLIIAISLCLLVGVVSADTLIIFPSSDLRVSRVGSGITFANLISGAGTESTSAANSSITLLTITTGWGTNRRYIAVFNGSALTADATIDSAKLRMYATPTSSGTFGTTNFKLLLTGVTPTSLTTLQTSDYNKFTSTVYSDSINYADWIPDTNQNFTLNAAGLSAINKTGLFSIGMCHYWDYNATFEGTYGNSKSNALQFAPLAFAGSSYDPYLEITYTPSHTTSPVASFTCTKNFLRIPNSVTCTDTSTNTPTSWSWNMGDGTAALTTQNVTYQYLKRGSWGITLNATNAGGSNTTPTATNMRVTGYENYW